MGKSNDDNLAKGKESIELEKKLKRKYGKEFIAELRGLDKSGLEGKLLGMANHNQEIITTKNRDEELEKAKDHHNELASVYKDQINANKDKTRFIHLILKEQSGDVDYAENDTQISLSVS